MILKYLIEIGFFIGLVANALLFVPQAIKIYRAKSAKEISFLTFFGFNIIQAFTAMHAYLSRDYLLLIGSILAFITCGTVTYLTFLYKFYQKEVTP
jgi:MtN3 and saliva related transmembrane protein